MQTLRSTPGALRLLTLSIVARLPLVMLGIGLLIHTVHLTGSFAAAGLVTAAHALALGIGGPCSGSSSTGAGRRPALVAGAPPPRALLCVVAVVPAGAPSGAAVASWRRASGSRATRPGRLRALAAAVAAARPRRRAGRLRRRGLGRRVHMDRRPSDRARARRALLDRRRARDRQRRAARRHARVRRAAGLARVAARSRPARPRGGALRAPAMQTLVAASSPSACSSAPPRSRSRPPPGRSGARPPPAR